MWFLARCFETLKRTTTKHHFLRLKPNLIKPLQLFRKLQFASQHYSKHVEITFKNTPEGFLPAVQNQSRSSHYKKTKVSWWHTPGQEEFIFDEPASFYLQPSETFRQLQEWRQKPKI